MGPRNSAGRKATRIRRTARRGVWGHVTAWAGLNPQAARADAVAARWRLGAEAERETAVVIGEASSPTEPRKKRKKAPFVKLDLPSRIQQAGTLQKNIFTWVRGQYGDTYRLAVIARAIRPAHASTPQRFAVVVSLEGEDDRVNVFNLVRTRLAAGRVRVRVPA